MEPKHPHESVPAVGGPPQPREIFMVMLGKDMVATISARSKQDAKDYLLEIGFDYTHLKSYY